MRLKKNLILYKLKLNSNVWIGCTGTGKTKLSIELAKKYKGEIINADALQLYQGLDIATNKATIEEMSNIPHHLIGYLDPMNKNYTVKDYKKKAIEIVSLILTIYF